jgi:hypothetical protein
LVRATTQREISPAFSPARYVQIGSRLARGSGDQRIAQPIPLDSLHLCHNNSKLSRIP